MHLKRFEYDGTKLYNRVIINENLQLAGKSFVLCSVVLHRGNENFGHYTTLHRSISKEFILLDDEIVTIAKSKDWTTEQLNNYAYICLYRVNDNENNDKPDTTSGKQKEEMAMNNQSNNKMTGHIQNDNIRSIN